MSIEADIIEEAKKVETAVEDAVKPLAPEAKAMRIDITDAEKVVLRTLECSYLRGVNDATKVAQQMEAFKSQYVAKLKELTEKYVKGDAEMVWNELEAVFVRVKKSL